MDYISEGMQMITGMAHSRSAAIAGIHHLAGQYLLHCAKYIFSKDTIDQNHWHNELNTWYSDILEIGEKLKDGKKLKEKDYLNSIQTRVEAPSGIGRIRKILKDKYKIDIDSKELKKELFFLAKVTAVYLGRGKSYNNGMRVVIHGLWGDLHDKHSS